MSSDLTIPIGLPLPTSTLIEEVGRVLRDLLQTSEPPPLHIEALDGGVVSQMLPPVLDDKSPALLFFLHDRNRIETGVTVHALELHDLHSEEDYAEVLTAIVSMTGGGGITRLRFVTVATCAIAIARQADSVIQDHGLRWSNRFEYEPSFLLESLRCKRQHDSLEAAFEEVLGNIEEAKGKR